MTTIQKKRVAALVAALRSGRYKQGKNQLRRGDRFCCLGVACDLYGKATKTQWKVNRFGDPIMLKSAGMLPFEVRDWFGLDSCDPVLGRKNPALASVWNDERKAGFQRIATLFERKYMKAKQAKP